VRVTILQPCFYPPRAYFELVRSADVCLLLTDVAFARRQGVTRTRIRDEGWMTVPVNRPYSKRQRTGTTPLSKVVVRPFDEWLPGHCQRLLDVYVKKCIEGHPIFEDFCKLSECTDNLVHVLYRSIKSIMRYFNISTTLTDSREYRIAGLSGQKKVIELCRCLGATELILHTGKSQGYDPVAFQRKGVRLKYVEPNQAWNKLSILDEAFTWWH